MRSPGNALQIEGDKRLVLNEEDTMTLKRHAIPLLNPRLQL